LVDNIGFGICGFGIHLPYLKKYNNNGLLFLIDFAADDPIV